MINLNFTLIIQVINFLFLMWALNRLLFRPILKNLSEREGEVIRLKKHAEELSQKAKEVQEEYNKKIKQAQMRALEEKERAREKSLEEAAQLLRGAQAEAEKRLMTTKELMIEKAESARRGFDHLGRDLAQDILNKLLG
ncbi:MAG: ATP synthase F0 subunit B [bacterium]